MLPNFSSHRNSPASMPLYLIGMGTANFVQMLVSTLKMCKGRYGRQMLVSTLKIQNQDVGVNLEDTESRCWCQP